MLKAFFRGIWEVAAFVLSAVGSVAYLLVGHWDIAQTDDRSEPCGEPWPR